MPRSAIPLVVGRGINRAVGLAAASPEWPVDVRNLYGRDGKLAVRPGMQGTGFPQLAWGTDILAVVGVKATLDILFCLYDRSSRELRLFRLDTTTSTIQSLAVPSGGLWGTLNPQAEFPVVVAAEADGRVFFAHAEPLLDYRLPTIYYTPDFVNPTAVGTATILTADLDGDGVAGQVKFFGVIQYLDYLVGWGWASETDTNGGNVARVSLPIQPTQFLPGNYALFGVPRDPIVGAVEVGNAEGGQGILALGKEDATYALTGTNFDTFLPVLLDARYGFVSARAQVNVGGRAFTWSGDGAREVTLSGTVPIAQPLELISPLPATFPAAGPPRECFVAYDTTRYLLSWCFPNLTTAAVPVAEFALSLWDPSNPRWTFLERQQPVACVGYQVVRVTGDPLQPPDGYASSVQVEDGGLGSDARYRRLRVSWQNNVETGAETVQVFLRVAGGTWAVAQTLAILRGDQTTTLEGVPPLTLCEVAIRYLNGNVSGVGYESGDPDTWTAPTAPGAKGSTTTTAEAPSALAGTYRASGTVPFTWASAQQGVAFQLEKSTDGGFSWGTVATGISGTAYTYTVPGGEVGTTVQFRVAAVNGATLGAYSTVLPVTMTYVVGNVTFTTWPGGSMSPYVVSVGLVRIAWTPASGASDYELQYSTNAGGSWNPLTIATGNLTGTSNKGIEWSVPQALWGQTVRVRVRGRAGADLGDWTESGDFALSVALPAVSSISVTKLETYPGGGLYRFRLTLPVPVGSIGYFQVNGVPVYGGVPLRVGATAGPNVIAWDLVTYVAIIGSGPFTITGQVAAFGNGYYQYGAASPPISWSP